MGAAELFTQNSYTIRRRVLKIFGASFEVFDPNGGLLAFSSQKAFKLKEDIRVFADRERQREILSIQARQIVDFAAAYDVVDTTSGQKVGAARRRGFRSMARDSWQLLDTSDAEIAQLEEDSMWKAMARRLLSNLIPQRFTLTDAQGAEVAALQVHFNPFVYRMSVKIAPEAAIDRRLVFGTAVLVCAIEGRQQ